MPYITEIYAREILDSKGMPTIETEVYLESGAFGRASVPSGMASLLNEAVELRDKDNKRFNGNGVLNAVNNVNKVIAKSLIGEDARDQIKIDRKLIQLDGTINKSNLGVNAILSVSIAVSRAAAEYSALPLYQYLGGFSASTLPVPIVNMIDGYSNNLDIKEFSIMPTGAPTIKEALRMTSEIYYSLKELLNKDSKNTSVGDEGGFALNPISTTLTLDYLVNAIKSAGYSLRDASIALNVNANSLFDKETKKYKIDNELKTTDEMINYYSMLIEKYPIISLEDVLSNEDIAGFKKLTLKLSKRVQLVGSDLFLTDPKKLQRGINEKYANAINIKPSQIGTLTEVMETIEMAKRSSFGIIIGDRINDTEDTFISDLAVAVNAREIKIGSMSRSERIAKYNQLIRIEENLSLQSKYAGKKLK